MLRVAVWFILRREWVAAKWTRVDGWQKRFECKSLGGVLGILSLLFLARGRVLSRQSVQLFHVVTRFLEIRH